MGPPPPAPLPDELVEEIFLRIPPTDPATLAHAAVAQKRWCRLVAGLSFRRRYRDRHRTPPMLGFFCERRDGKSFISTSFVPASSFRPKPLADRRQLCPVDARHGRVLLHAYKQFVEGKVRLVVWDPITRHRVALPRPDGLGDDWHWRATVLCAAPAGSCDHLDCHRGHFIVVLIGNYPRYYPRAMFSCVYSSQAYAWSKIIFARHLHHTLRNQRSAHVGNALYCMLDSGNKILKFDLGTREFSVMEPPPLLLHGEFTCSDKIELTTMEDGQLGLAVLCQSTLYILSTDEEFGWGGTKIIDLEKCGNYVPSTTRPYLIGFAGDIGLVFIEDEKNGILSVDIRSAQVKVVDKKPCIYWFVPYINFCFCTPAIGMPSKDHKPREGASRDVQSCVAVRGVKGLLGLSPLGLISCFLKC